MREEYVEKDGKVIDQIEKDKNYVKKLLIVIGIIIFIVLSFFITRSIIRNNTCNGIIKKVRDASLSYAKDKNILPKAEGDYVRLSLSDLLEDKKIATKDIIVNEEQAQGKIKITKYIKDYIVTVELTHCAYCDSSNKKWGKEISKKPNKPIFDVIAYYNYQKKSTNYTNWTQFIETDKLNVKTDEKYNIRLPLENSKLPSIPNDAFIETIEQETKEYYRYRDNKCKYYKDNGGVYTDYFVSEKPDGYENVDQRTEKYTEWSDYSLNYPEKKSYRQIETRTGYKWYYLDKKGKKIYYKNGAYAVEVVSSKKYVKDNNEGSAKMYRYRDKQWRFYNGAKRQYSGYSAVAPSGYTLKDSELCNYTTWSAWTDQSKLTNQNRSYRQEEIDTRYRYRIQYSVLSLPVFEKAVSKEKLEQSLEQDIDEILARKDLKIEISYRFKVKK